MTTLTLFIILLIVGVILITFGSHMSGMNKLLFIIMGLFIFASGVFGIVTSFL